MFKLLRKCNFSVLFRHPRSMLKRQLRTSNLFLTQVNVLPKLSNCIQWGVVLKTQPTNLRGNVNVNLQIREKPKDTFTHTENTRTLGVTLKEHTISAFTPTERGPH